MPYTFFADEIAIDFPSVNHLVERVCDGFLDERPRADVLTAEVSVSSLDAAAGTVVPFELLVRGTCEGCGGRGETWSEFCLACRGTGDAFARRPVRFAVPPGVADGSRFRFRVSSPGGASVRVEVRVAVRNL